MARRVRWSRTRRGPYRGAFGYFAPTGFELALAIRIRVLTERELRIHVGGGIVADSEPAAELAETETKAAGWISALAAVAELAALAGDAGPGRLR